MKSSLLRKTNPIFRRACKEIAFSGMTISTQFSLVEFIEENGGGPGVRLRKPAKAEALRAGLRRFCETKPISLLDQAHGRERTEALLTQA
jgi:hypothetical protein